MHLYELYLPADSVWLTARAELLALCSHRFYKALQRVLRWRRHGWRNVGDGEKTVRSGVRYKIGAGVVLKNAYAFSTWVNWETEMQNVRHVSCSYAPAPVLLPSPYLTETIGCNFVYLKDVVSQPSVKEEKPLVAYGHFADASENHTQVRKYIDLSGEGAGAAMVSAGESISEDRCSGGLDISDQGGHELVAALLIGSNAQVRPPTRLSEAKASRSA